MLVGSCTTMQTKGQRDKGFVTYSLVASASEDSAEGAEDLDKIHDTDGKSPDVISWYEQAPLAPARGGQSVNDVLMILVNPP